ncbi:eukaryotic translation initiation factor 3 subunit F-2 [Drosophila busckii]|uniref:eukaryotic translation initiation factor 3 subunit F-2 n=1 Tax=Drosophila busckii TaxID=30019 RepID=UPI00083EB090|nr:eukaryotic translation initiation factor 3 subunit F-2 [Drosophila busckii]
MNYKLQSNVRLQPLVLFQIIDAYERRSQCASMAVGTLLGRRCGDVIEITNSFTVQHKEQQVGELEHFKLDTQYATEMHELNQMSYPQEKIMGWFSTGKSLSRSAAALHVYYARESGEAQPLHLLVDTTLRGGRLNTRLYCAVTMGVPDGTRGLMFTLLPLLKMDIDSDEAVALRFMQKQVMHPTKQLGRLLPELVSVVDSLREIELKLDMVLRYINDVLARKRLPDNNVGRALYDALTSVPLLDAEAFRSVFNANVRDMLLSITLSSMIKTQMELSEKLSCLPNH